MIQIEKLRKVYDNGHEALKSINLEMNEGELVCLLGPSGCGKTTILNLLAGLLDPTSGDIKFDNESVIDKHPKDRNIGLVFQNYALYPHMTVLENVMFPLTVGKKKMPKAEAMEIAKKYMKITSIEELADKKPGNMSGGQQQRVAITRALVQNPKILLLDEPLSNLDARLRLKIREEIRRLVKEIGITTIFVTHDQEEALSISDRIVLMNEGIVQQFDIPQNLYLEPANLFVAKFMGNPIINIFEFEKEGNMLKGENFSIDLNLLNKDRFKAELTEGKYIVGIRPEYFVTSEKPLFEAKIETVELIGKDCIVNFNVNGVHAKSITDVNQNIRENDEVGFDIDYNGIYLFQENGVRVY
ncbi:MULTISPECIES: ABC transporter ATP-binding protein [Terrisporobacter]|uniref:ABC transporter ATP-binding protein n=1 Tax=Terrisporobacter muris TaxID=2963284 RepID=A0A9X2M9K0_9FIRM|nr:MULTISPECIES: ABC transporter ATP-binding protein [Terrisporobacter]MCR1821757.1 ABC transporter ATP-binding protein [Terrisporobacter muris]MDU6984502.1 ABC transporter ATP-binding protein [Terrisporobacter othiniensis]MDY3371748.1 ABC transporter ATP-binding protein [Terrisporobacter othiniensis]